MTPRPNIPTLIKNWFPESISSFCKIGLLIYA
jgi:hypothetical protein